MTTAKNEKKTNASGRATYVDLSALPDCLRLSDERIKREIAHRVDRIRDYFRANGFSEAVIGLSGGIDSAVAAALTVRALGPTNLWCLRLPCGRPTESVRIATDVAERLRILPDQQFTVDIAPAVEASLAAARAGLGLTGPTDRLQYGNLAARERMKMLMFAASRHRAILIGTENLTEHLLAYFTIGGDNISGLEPIRDLYKCQVYQLAAALGLPDSVLRRKPTAELWDGQTDEDELGIPYPTIDTVFAARDLGLDAMATADRYGLAPETVRRVLDFAASRTGKINAPFIVPPLEK